MKREVEEEKERAKAVARERVLIEFEKGQLALATHTTAGITTTTSGADSKDSEHFTLLFFRC